MKKIYSILLGILLFGIQVDTAIAHVRLSAPFNVKSMNIGEQFIISWEIVQAHDQKDWDLYYSVDSGATWIIIKENILASQLNYTWTVPDKPTTKARIKIFMDNNVEADYEDISAAFTIKSGTVGIATIGKETDFFELTNSYPNPFSINTNFKFKIHEKSEVTLEIYSMQGIKVATLINKELYPGEFKVDWDASLFASGFYVFKMKAGNQVASNRLLLIRNE